MLRAAVCPWSSATTQCSTRIFSPLCGSGHLSLTFGHIAHYNMHGFWGVFFEDLPGKIHFLEQTAAWPCHGDPEFTFSDVERAIARRVGATGLIQRYRAALADELEQRERQQLDRLTAKYESVAR